MSHPCPDCGQQCHCNGDIDDLDWGEDSAQADACICCLNAPDYDEPYEDDPAPDEEAP